MPPVIATVVVSYKRPELLRKTLASYLETVTLPYWLLVVDNGGSDDALAVAQEFDVETIELGDNRFPGYATNVGWDKLNEYEPAFLHRSDNDVEYLPGWCEEVVTRFEENPKLGQLGLRTVAEEGNYPNVGGNCVVTPLMFSLVRWGDGAWERHRPTEDLHFSVAVKRNGWQWERVRKPCIVHLGDGTPKTDPYYAETWAAKGYGGY